MKSYDLLVRVDYSERVDRYIYAFYKRRNFTQNLIRLYLSFMFEGTFNFPLIHKRIYVL